jgi:hypothetical protein
MIPGLFFSSKNRLDRVCYNDNKEKWGYPLILSGAGITGIIVKEKAVEKSFFRGQGSASV